MKNVKIELIIMNPKLLYSLNGFVCKCVNFCDFLSLFISFSFSFQIYPILLFLWIFFMIFFSFYFNYVWIMKQTYFYVEKSNNIDKLEMVDSFAVVIFAFVKIVCVGRCVCVCVIVIVFMLIFLPLTPMDLLKTIKNYFMCV